MERKLVGTILWCNRYKGYGEIETDSKEKFFFLISSVSPDLSLQIADRVVFLIGNKKLFGCPLVQNIEKSGLTKKSTKKTQVGVTL